MSGGDLTITYTPTAEGFNVFPRTPEPHLLSRFALSRPRSLYSPHASSQRTQTRPPRKTERNNKVNNTFSQCLLLFPTLSASSSGARQFEPHLLYNRQAQMVAQEEPGLNNLQRVAYHSVPRASSISHQPSAMGAGSTHWYLLK